MIQEQLTEYINSIGIKQKTIAEKCGMTEMAVSSSMRNERKLTLDEYGAICEFLGLSLDTFNSKSAK